VATNLQLCVVGSSSLDDMHAMLASSFGLIKKGAPATPHTKTEAFPRDRCCGIFREVQVSERSERALMKSSILAINPAKWLQPPTSTTKLTHSIRLVRSAQPVKDLMSLKLSFPNPPHSFKNDPHLKAKSHSLVSHLLGERAKRASLEVWSYFEFLFGGTPETPLLRCAWLMDACARLEVWNYFELCRGLPSPLRSAVRCARLSAALGWWTQAPSLRSLRSLAALLN